ncbi:helix-turn-helix domain-containing protein [Streptomyces sp. NPDC059708]|uniref:helix-turn-helix domain-containing protein n=1 Tax=Streptomyces sp. NPDC059708 TaxID=3346916 RepID=UPI00367904D3
MERIIEEIREDLDRRLAVAADRLTDRTLTEDPAYAALLGRAELRERVHHTLRQTVEGLVRVSRAEPVELAGARATGALRAGQGLPLGSLRRVYRRAGRLVWQCLTEAVAAHDRAALPRLLAGAGALWDVLDQLAEAASEAYHAAEAERGERERERRAALLDALLDDSGPAAAAPEPAAAAAARLGLPERGRFAVVVLAPSGPAGDGPDGPGPAPGGRWYEGYGTGAGGGSGDGAPGPAPGGGGYYGVGAGAAGPASRPGPGGPGGTGGPGPGPGGGSYGGDGAGGPASRQGPGGPGGAGGGSDGPRVLWRIRADGETGVAELGPHPLEALRALLAPLPVRAGISPVVATPAELAGARRLAALALRTGPSGPGPGAAALLDERLPAALVAADPELAGRLREVVLGPVLALPPQEARVLLVTLGTWLACRGSTTYAAQRLYCHRNTVSNRLRRLEQLTGRALSDPAHVVELALAHAAVVQRPTAPPSPPADAGDGPTPAGTARRSPRSPG